MPNTREKLIELLETAADPLDVAIYGEVRVTTSKVADHLIANGVTVTDTNVGEWISVKDRLPEKKGTFLVCTKNDFYCTKNIAKARFCNGEWHGTGGVWSNVTHWMPLPEPPKGE
jgi:hypothetical protein